MIEGVIFLALFYIAFKLIGGATYVILLISAVANVVLYSFTSEYSVLLPATIDALTLSALIAFADKHRGLQLRLLFIALSCHLFIELIRPVATDAVFWGYGAAITIITVWQLSGAANAVIDRFLERLWHSGSDSELFNYSIHPMEAKTCRTKQQER